ncbi:hypothetical protein AAMO2058_000737700 [Amorphochlora amoebiformis]
MGYVLPLWTVPELIVLTEAVYLCFTDGDTQSGSVKKVDWKKVAQNLKEKAFRRDSATFYTAQVCQLRFIQLLKESNVPIATITPNNLTKTTRHVNQQLRARRQQELTQIVREYQKKIAEFEAESDSVRAGRMDPFLITFINTALRTPNSPYFYTVPSPAPVQLIQQRVVQATVHAQRTPMAVVQPSPAHAIQATAAAAYTAPAPPPAPSPQRASAQPAHHKPVVAHPAATQVSNISSNLGPWNKGPDWLPEGWMWAEVQRVPGQPAERYFRSPNGVVFSTAEAAMVAAKKMQQQAKPANTTTTTNAAPQGNQTRAVPVNAATPVSSAQTQATPSTQMNVETKITTASPVQRASTIQNHQVYQRTPQVQPAVVKPPTAPRIHMTPTPSTGVVQSNASIDVKSGSEVSRKRPPADQPVMSPASLQAPKRKRVEPPMAASQAAPQVQTPDTPQEPQRRKTPGNGERFRGVYPTKSNKWQAKICRSGTLEHLGTFFTAIEAARAWDKRAMQLGKTPLNFPAEAQQEPEAILEVQAHPQPSAVEEKIVAAPKPNVEVNNEEVVDKLQDIWNLVKDSKLAESLMEPFEVEDSDVEVAADGYSMIGERLSTGDLQSLGDFYDLHGSIIRAALLIVDLQTAARDLDRFVLDKIKELFPSIDEGAFEVQPDPPAHRKLKTRKRTIKKDLVNRRTKVRTTARAKKEEKPEPEEEAKKKRASRATRRAPARRKELAIDDDASRRRGRPRKR